MSTMDELARRVREERKRRHMTQQQLADAAGVYKGTVSNFETRKRDPQPQNLRSILGVLDMLEDDPGSDDELPEGPNGQWAMWEKDIRTFLNVIGMYLEAQPERERTVIMREASHFIFKRPRNGTNRTH